MPLNVKNHIISSNDITSAGVFKTKVNRDGIVLYYDAADVDSTGGGGSIWYDLSGNGYNGTLTNGASFTSTNGGSVLFDGSNDYVETNSSTIIPNGLSPFTIEVRCLYKWSSLCCRCSISNRNKTYGINKK